MSIPEKIVDRSWSEAMVRMRDDGRMRERARHSAHRIRQMDAKRIVKRLDERLAGFCRRYGWELAVQEFGLHPDTAIAAAAEQLGAMTIAMDGDGRFHLAPVAAKP